VFVNPFVAAFCFFGGTRFCASGRLVYDGQRNNAATRKPFDFVHGPEPVEGRGPPASGIDLFQGQGTSPNFAQRSKIG
jgi:hypothetical protein